jgi:hypothetical protein
MMVDRTAHAFPFGYPNVAPGLTKREYFAGLAMQGILARKKMLTDEGRIAKMDIAVKYADALLTALESAEATT